MTLGWTLAAVAGGVVVGFALGTRRARRREGGSARPLDLAQALDLVRRAHNARAGWAVGCAEGDLAVQGAEQIAPDAARRCAALVQLASGDGRTHVAPAPDGVCVAVGDFPHGAGLLLSSDPPSGAAEQAADDLRRLVATMRLADRQSPVRQSEELAARLALATSGAHTLDGLARAAVDVAEKLAQRGAVLVLQDPGTRRVHVQAVSAAADRRLLGIPLAAEAPVSRAIEQAVPVVTYGMDDIFGPGVPERRRRDRAGTAYPLGDGHAVIGALVVLGPPVDVESPPAVQIGRLVTELGPRIAAARALHEAERLAVRDPLTGLANLRELERVMRRFSAEEAGSGARPAVPASLVYVDLDHFKQLNDTLGHAAGDAALRHAARVLERELRDGDLVARIGGEEFAIWLPRTPVAEGCEVADRVRRALAEAPWHWNGGPRRLTASCGIATYPDHVRDVANLRTAADAALYRAKQAGRNRVEMAPASR